MPSAPKADADFACGQSPFRVKGLVYGAARECYDQTIRGGSDVVAAMIESAPLRAFFEQTFLPGAWYDALPMVRISAVAARAAGRMHAALVRGNAAWVAARDVRGVYKFLLQLASPEMVALRLGRVSMQYFDFGGAEGKMIKDKVLESHRFGIPAPMAQWFIHAAEGFTPVALELTGARDVRVRS
jgi:hypothetical protein